MKVTVEVGGQMVATCVGMRWARQFAAMHVIGLVRSGGLRTGEPIGVVYRSSNRIISESEMIGPDLENGGLIGLPEER